MTAAATKVVTASVEGAAAARVLAPLMMKCWRRRTTSPKRASSKASRLSILITFTPPRLSITAVERADVSFMAPDAALRVRLPNWRMTRAATGAPPRTTVVRSQSSLSITTNMAATCRAFWV